MTPLPISDPPRVCPRSDWCETCDVALCREGCFEPGSNPFTPRDEDGGDEPSPEDE